MKLFNVLLPLILLLLGVAALRYQFFSVIEKATKPSESGVAGLPMGTPISITPICGMSGRKTCDFPGLIYGTPKPSRGITAPSR